MARFGSARNEILIAYAMGQLVRLRELLNEAPSFMWVEGFEGCDRDKFFDAVRRAEIEHKDMAHREYLFTALSLDGAAEETGMHPGDRVTCHSCKAWADHTH
ncbi:hypothetical protein DMH04_24030 [Kibdelosporangium aridum]|uniref:Uncharacterized protein n=1 Tax=Kibdelosporangium aridum TaxID=2030 RepID=A0A428Z724_KIBAR|nr:hypothetical protein [Kibdelosporangium aridum]RSM83202.1 hypothetical protein DMH04_24030 [Kibdelosporangium aridum]